MNKKIIIAIFLIAAILRFYRLGDVPIGLDWDENSNAYNAYSILKTGKDEYGKFLPLANRSFDDYKPPLYMYLDIPAVALFGLTPFAARLPAAIFGFLTIPLMYFLAKRLFENTQFKESAPLIATFLLAVSPWHVQFSRVGFEATIGLFFTMFSVATFFFGLKNKKWLIATAISVGLSFYSYHSQRIFIPLIFLVLAFLYKEKLLGLSKKYIGVLLVIAALIIAPLFLFAPREAVFSRFKSTSLGQRYENSTRSINYIHQDEEQNFQIATLFHNRRLVTIQTLFGEYLNHFSPNFLFLEGDDNLRHHIEHMGMLYLFELPLILMGIYHALKIRSRELIFVLLWLVLSPLAAAVASPTPHAIRSLPMVIALEILGAYGLSVIVFFKFKYSKQITLTAGVIILISVGVYLHNYYTHYSYYAASYWQHDYNQAVEESEKLKSSFEKIYVDVSIEQAYAFWLFGLKYDPIKYQQSGTRKHFGNYYFDQEEKPQKSTELYISEAKKFPRDYKVLKTIYHEDGTEAIKIGYHP